MDVDTRCLRCSEAKKTVENFISEAPFSTHIWRASNIGFNFDLGNPLGVEEWLTDDWVKKASKELILESLCCLGFMDA